MSERAWKWDRRKTKAAVLLASGDHNRDKICELVPCDKNTLARWKRVPEFRDRVQEIRDEILDDLVSHGVGNKSRRIRRLNKHWEDLMQVLTTKDLNAKLEGLHGEHGGMLAARRVDDWEVKDGKRKKITKTIFVFDRDVPRILKEMREIEKAAATEVGDFIQKIQLDPSDGSEPVRILMGVLPQRKEISPGDGEKQRGAAKEA